MEPRSTHNLTTPGRSGRGHPATTPPSTPSACPRSVCRPGATLGRALPPPRDGQGVALGWPSQVGGPVTSIDGLSVASLAQKRWRPRIGLPPAEPPWRFRKGRLQPSLLQVRGFAPRLAGTMFMYPLALAGASTCSPRPRTSSTPTSRQEGCARSTALHPSPKGECGSLWAPSCTATHTHLHPLQHATSHPPRRCPPSLPAPHPRCSAISGAAPVVPDGLGRARRSLWDGGAWVCVGGRAGL